MSTMTGGEAIVVCLQAYGVDTIFGIPGVHNLAIYDALRRTPAIRAITTRHEGGAGFMADGYARVTGRPGVCITITGPGAANALSPLTNAYADSSPVLLITSEVDNKVGGRGLGAFHEAPSQIDMLRGAVGWAERVTQAADIPAAFDRAWRAMTTGRPRPAALEIPTNILNDKADIPAPRPSTPSTPELDMSAVVEAANLLRRAERPIIYAGQGVLAAGASAELAAVAEALAAPVMMTYVGRGAIPADHPLSLGCGWTWPSGPFASFLSEADAVLIVGSSLDVMDTRDGTLPLPSQRVQIDIDAQAINKLYPITVPIVADARQALAALASVVSRQTSVVSSQMTEVTSHKSQVTDHKSQVTGHKSQVTDHTARLTEVTAAIAGRRAEAQALIATKLGWQFIQTIQAASPRSAIIIGDAATINGWQLYHLPVYEPRTAPFPMHSAALGFALPAAIGAKLAQPQAAVIALCGDGGALFTAQELATAMHYGVNVVLVVFNDQGYRSIEGYQRRLYGEVYAGELTNPDFTRYAEAFGALGLCAETPAALEGALRYALAADRPAIIEVPVEVGGVVW